MRIHSPAWKVSSLGKNLQIFDLTQWSLPCITVPTVCLSYRAFVPEQLLHKIRTPSLLIQFNWTCRKTLRRCSGWHRQFTYCIGETVTYSLLIMCRLFQAQVHFRFTMALESCCYSNDKFRLKVTQSSKFH